MRLIQVLMIAALLGPTGAVMAAEAVVYVSPTGNDAGKGGTEADAVATIQRAVKLAEAMPAGTTLAKIVLKPGTYKAQSFETRGHRENVPILITSGNGGSAVFDGDGQGGTWMTLKPRGGNPSNIRIERIGVTNYETVIDVDGNRNKPELWAGGLEIRDNHFSRVGDISRVGAKPSTAAIRLVNSDRNVIVKNTFTEIRNNDRCPLLHALYVAHGSTDNRIEENLFENSCGDAVRFRDRSDNNVVRKNRFVDAWSRSPVSDWFCNPAQRSNCTKEEGECPSFNNVVENNEVTARSMPAAGVFVPYGGKPPPGCGVVRGAQRAIVR
jgi:hypothetical protein